jgi:hypothetical protein
LSVRKNILPVVALLQDVLRVVGECHPSLRGIRAPLIASLSVSALIDEELENPGDLPTNRSAASVALHPFVAAAR